MSFAKRNYESRSLIFNNPTVPIIYPASGLQVEPLQSIFIPLTITEVLPHLELKITSNFGKFGISDESKPVLSLSGDINSVSQKLKTLRKVSRSMIFNQNFDELLTRMIFHHLGFSKAFEQGTLNVIT